MENLKIENYKNRPFESMAHNKRSSVDEWYNNGILGIVGRITQEIGDILTKKVIT